ncbi:MAG TPA: hypothetical protein VG604_04405 [Candidatus Saccharimonadales bacterium]|nr:hypothetical protein [Candidatus Saccharimonadales bacterium]
MLAAIGFIITGGLVTAFAETFERIVARPHKLNLWQFSAAYYALGLALMVWGIASLTNTSQILQFSVYVGDALLLAGSVLLLSLVTPSKYYQKVLLIEVFVALVLLATRATYYQPEPAMKDGILLFNTQWPVAAVLGAAFTLIWLPVNVRVAQIVTAATKLKGVGQLYVSLYVGAVLAALFFLSSKRFAAVVLSFMTIGVVFALLVASNFVTAAASAPAKKKAARHGK